MAKRISKDKLGTHSTILRHVPPWFITPAERLENIRYKMRYAGMARTEMDAMIQEAKNDAATSTIRMLDWLWTLFEQWKESK